MTPETVNLLTAASHVLVAVIGLGGAVLTARITSARVRREVKKVLDEELPRHLGHVNARLSALERAPAARAVPIGRIK